MDKIIHGDALFAGGLVLFARVDEKRSRSINRRIFFRGDGVSLALLRMRLGGGAGAALFGRRLAEASKQVRGDIDDRGGVRGAAGDVVCLGDSHLRREPYCAHEHDGVGDRRSVVDSHCGDGGERGQCVCAVFLPQCSLWAIRAERPAGANSRPDFLPRSDDHPVCVGNFRRADPGGASAAAQSRASGGAVLAHDVCCYDVAGNRIHSGTEGLGVAAAVGAAADLFWNMRFASLLPRLSVPWQILGVCGCGIDFVLGILFQLHNEHAEYAVRPVMGQRLPGIVLGDHLPSQFAEQNIVAKHILGYHFIGDAFPSAWTNEVLLCLAFVGLLVYFTRRALSRREEPARLELHAA